MEDTHPEDGKTDKVFEACAIPAPSDQRKEWDDVTKADVAKMIETNAWVGKPLMIEHGKFGFGELAGHVTRTWSRESDGAMMVEYKCDAPNYQSEFARKHLNRGRFAGVSVAYRVSNKDPVELSLCLGDPRRAGAVITRWTQSSSGDAKAPNADGVFAAAPLLVVPTSAPITVPTVTTTTAISSSSPVVVAPGIASDKVPASTTTTNIAKISPAASNSTPEIKINSEAIQPSPSKPTGNNDAAAKPEVKVNTDAPAVPPTTTTTTTTVGVSTTAAATATTKPEDTPREELAAIKRTLATFDPAAYRRDLANIVEQAISRQKEKIEPKQTSEKNLTTTSHVPFSASPHTVKLSDDPKQVRLFASLASEYKAEKEDMDSKASSSSSSPSAPPTGGAVTSTAPITSGPPGATGRADDVKGMLPAAGGGKSLVANPAPALTTTTATGAGSASASGLINPLVAAGGLNENPVPSTGTAGKKHRQEEQMENGRAASNTTTTTTSPMETSTTAPTTNDPNNQQPISSSKAQRTEKTSSAIDRFTAPPSPKSNSYQRSKEEATALNHQVLAQQQQMQEMQRQLQDMKDDAKLQSLLVQHYKAYPEISPTRNLIERSLQNHGVHKSTLCALLESDLAAKPQVPASSNNNQQQQHQTAAGAVPQQQQQHASTFAAPPQASAAPTSYNHANSGAVGGGVGMQHQVPRDETKSAYLNATVNDLTRAAHQSGAQRPPHYDFLNTSMSPDQFHPFVARSITDNLMRMNGYNPSGNNNNNGNPMASASGSGSGSGAFANPYGAAQPAAFGMRTGMNASERSSIMGAGNTQVPRDDISQWSTLANQTKGAKAADQNLVNFLAGGVYDIGQQYAGDGSRVWDSKQGIFHIRGLERP